MAGCGSDSARWVWMGLVSLFGLAELVSSQLSDSLALLLDSFHSLSVLLELALPVLGDWLDRRPIPSSHTFGWQRLAAVGSLVADLLALSLCCSVTADALARFLDPHPFHRPLLPVAAGTAGIFLNLGIHLWLRSAGRGGSYGPCPESGQGYLDTAGEHQRLKDTGGDAADGLGAGEWLAEAGGVRPTGASSDTEGPRCRLACAPEPALILSNPCLGLPSEVGHSSSPFLPPLDPDIRRQPEDWSHGADSTGRESRLAVAGSTGDRDLGGGERDSASGWREALVFLAGAGQRALGSAVALAVGLLHRSPAGGRPYLDPGLSLVTALALAGAALPRLRATVPLLLECVPARVDLQRLAEGLAGAGEGVQGVHELHVWRLSAGRVLASAHVRCRGPASFARAAGELRRAFRREGVHSATLQPEFTGPDAGGSKGATLCQLACGPHCAKKLCCDWPKGA